MPRAAGQNRFLSQCVKLAAGAGFFVAARQGSAVLFAAMGKGPLTLTLYDYG